MFLEPLTRQTLLDYRRKLGEPALGPRRDVANPRLQGSIVPQLSERP
jgi:hypothetical protein